MAPIGDVCTLLDVQFLNSLGGDSYTTKQAASQPGSYTDCIAKGAQGTYAVLAVAQGDLATNILAADYAAIQGASEDRRT